jgi:hypothetical protein
MGRRTHCPGEDLERIDVALRPLWPGLPRSFSCSRALTSSMVEENRTRLRRCSMAWTPIAMARCVFPMPGRRRGRRQSRAGETMVANATSDRNAIREEFYSFLWHQQNQRLTGKSGLIRDNAALSQSSLEYRSPFRSFRRCAEQPLRHYSLTSRIGAKATAFTFYRRPGGCSK